MSERTPQYCATFGAKRIMNAETFVLEARRLGIDENDVMASNSITQLLNWQIEISKDICNITGQIDMSAAYYHAEGRESDPVKYVKQKQAKRLLELLVQRINVRVQELKYTSLVKKNEFAETFMNTARQFLSPEIFQNLIDKTTSK